MLEHIPTDRQGRWDLLKVLIDEWQGGLRPGDGIAAEQLDAAERRLSLPLPRALKEWYLLAGGRADIWSRQDTFVAPEELCVRDGVLVFYIEKQAVVEWGIRTSDLATRDPSVVMRSPDEPARWIVQNDTTSEFALQMFVFSVKWSNRNHRANGAGNQELIRCIESRYRRFGFPDWDWPASPVRFYEGPGIIVEINGTGDGAWIWVTSRTNAAFRDFERLMHGAGCDWEASSEDWPPGWLGPARDP